MSHSDIAFSAELRRRLRQQDLIAGFGRYALRADRLQATLHEVCATAAKGLGARFAKVLEWRAEAGDFLLRAGVGWREGVVGRARVGADLASPAGYAFKTGEPTISNHLGDEGRFRTPRVLAEHGVKRAINVLVAEGDARYGVLEVDSDGLHDFSDGDLTFVQALADLLSAVIERQQRQEALSENEAFVREVLEASPNCVEILDAETGALRSTNASRRVLMGAGNAAAIEGRNWLDLWPEEEAPKARRALEEAKAGSVARFQAFCPAAAGAPKWWEVLVAPLTRREGRPAQLVSIATDVSEHVKAGAEKDLLMQEVHHRVKNSLHLVQGLLAIQGRAAADKGVGRQLVESAARVRTIASLHDRLYRTAGTLDVELAPYLRGLVDDLRASVASALPGRAIRLEADAATWPAKDATVLGLVLTELVTNALKYGEGVVRVSFRQAPGEQAVLTVDDEGTGLPEGFQPSGNAGLGMRLVNGLVGERGGSIRVDRGVGHTRFLAVMPRVDEAATA